VATAAALAYSLVVTFVLAWIINRTMGLRATREAEVDGIDEAEHAESAYDLVIHPSRRTRAVGAGRPAEGSRP